MRKPVSKAERERLAANNNKPEYHHPRLDVFEEASKLIGAKMKAFVDHYRDTQGNVSPERVAINEEYKVLSHKLCIALQLRNDDLLNTILAKVKAEA